MEAGISYRRAGAWDVATILELQQESASAPQWTEALWRRTLADASEPRRTVLVAERELQVCGFLAACVVGDVAELESVVVAEKARRRGIGRELCVRSMKWAREIGAKEMELEVRASNAEAQRLYRGLGFGEQGRRGKYYRDPEEDAILMAGKL